MDIFFNSHGRLGIIDIEGRNERYLDFDIPGQVNWGFGPQFADGQRMILVSYEAGKAWTGDVVTHLWVYDKKSHRIIREIANSDKPAPFMACSSILPSGERIVTNPIIDGIQRLWTMNLDGSDPVEVTGREDGFTYCVSPDASGDRLTFHATMIPGKPGYRIFTTDTGGQHRVEVAGHADHLYFGPTWSPDGEWLAYLDCHHQSDPGHDWADLCVGRPGGTEHRVITTGQLHWFGTSFGAPESRGSGSNMPTWSPDGSTVTLTRSKKGSRTAWPYQADRPDEDHVNRDYEPEIATGGTQVCLLDPFSGEITELTPLQDRVWDFRVAWSPDGAALAFCRSPVGQPAGLWTMEADGRNPRPLTTGFEGRGADHPVWSIQ